MISFIVKATNDASQRDKAAAKSVAKQSIGMFVCVCACVSQTDSEASERKHDWAAQRVCPMSNINSVYFIYIIGGGGGPSPQSRKPDDMKDWGR